MSNAYPSPDQIDRWITVIRDEGVNLTKWELDFMDSIIEQWERRRYLTETQLDKLESIYAERTP